MASVQTHLLLSNSCKLPSLTASRFKKETTCERASMSLSSSRPKSRKGTRQVSLSTFSNYLSSRRKSGVAMYSEDKQQPGHDFPPEVLDNIIEVFREKERENWPKFMAHSEEWPQLNDFVFERLAEKGEAEVDPDEAVEILTFLKALRNVDEEVAEQRDLLKMFQECSVGEVEPLVASKRAMIGPHFFDFVAMRVDALHAKPEARQELISLASQIASLCDALDRAAEDMEAADEAASTLQKLLMVSSLEEADKMIDELAANGGLNPALLLTTAKAYNSVKESEFTKGEIKDVMAHLYFKMKETTARQQPTEVRILKHLLAIEDPLERRELLTDAFTEGPELETPTDDLLCTKPDKLLLTIQTVLKAYDTTKNKTNLTGQAAELMNPAVIDRMREVEKEIERDFM